MVFHSDWVLVEIDFGVWEGEVVVAAGVCLEREKVTPAEFVAWHCLGVATFAGRKVPGERLPGQVCDKENCHLRASWILNGVPRAASGTNL